MAELQWSEELLTGVDVMDHDHQISVQQLHALNLEEDKTEFTRQFVAFADHLRTHFDREEELMDKHGFFATEIHKAEHQRVLKELNLIIKMAEAGDLSAAKRYVEWEFTEWFVIHHETMDSATANFLAGLSEDV